MAATENTTRQIVRIINAKNSSQQCGQASTVITILIQECCKDYIGWGFEMFYHPLELLQLLQDTVSVTAKYKEP